jgi:N-acetylglucosamine malate deacetylase 1
MKMPPLRQLIKLARHPRAFIDSVLTYSRYLGTIKPHLLSCPSREISVRLACFSKGWWPSQLRCPIGRRILAVSPHPDDETIGAGGLLIGHRQEAEISVVTIFKGDGGGLRNASSEADYKSQLAGIRIAELERACAYFSGQFMGCIGVSDGGLPSSESGERLRCLVDQVNPDVVILPQFLDHHPDHLATNMLWAKHCSDVKCVVLATEIWSLGFVNAYFDITDFLQRKLEAIAEFKTQLATVDYKSMAEGLAKVRGFHGALRDRRTGAAEGFFALPNGEYCDLALRFEPH